MRLILCCVNDVSFSSAYSFSSRKLRVNYGILDVYRVTAGVVKVVVAILCKVVKILSYCI